MASEFPGATPAQPRCISFPPLGRSLSVLPDPGGTRPARGTSPRAPRRSPLCPCTPTPGSHCAGLPRVPSSNSVPNSFSFCFFHQSQISGSHQAILCHLAGNSEAREKGKFPRWSKKPCKPGRWEFTVQLKMASAHQMETTPPECSCVCRDTHGSR